jgi:ABC-type uncharacterized transport system involved in gliding motility auxiliary subunit
MVMAIATLLMILALVVFPVLIPLSVALFHFVVRRRQHGQ